MLKYKWAKIGNLYTIFDVPIFGESKQRGVTKENLEAIVKTFNLDKTMKNYLPRIFLGHNTPDKDGYGVGFLDNLRFDKYIYANFIDIPENIFTELMLCRYPYHSVEYVDNEIVGLALLDSQPPHFKFPRRILEKNGVTLPEKYSRRKIMEKPIPEKDVESNETIKQEQFHDTLASIESMLKQLVSALQPNQKYSDEIKPNEVLKEMIDSIEDGALVPSSDVVLEGLLSNDQIDELIKLAEEEIKNKTPDAKPEDIQELAKSFVYSKNFYDRLLESPKQQKNKVNMEEESGFKKLYQRLANKNKLNQLGLDSNETHIAEATLEKFSSSKDASLFLEYLSQKDCFSRHPAQSVVDEWAKINPTKYDSLNAKKSKTAFRAKQAWTDTANHSNSKTAENFKKQWPTAEKFVDHVLLMSENNPGYLDTLIVEE